MPARRPLLMVTVILAGVVAATCESPQEPEVATPVPSRSVEAEPGRLSARDVQVYLTVKAKALQRMEEELDQLTVGSADLPARIEDLSVAERSAANALGVGWRRYAWIRDEIVRLLGDQRQREDARILMLELTRTRDDLKEQLSQVRDEASRQFLAAQLKSLDDKLAALESEGRVPQEEERELRLIEEARAELATLQGRQDRLQKRVRDMLQASRSRHLSDLTPTPVGTGSRSPALPTPKR